jgi:hypothetical protein
LTERKNCLILFTGTVPVKYIFFLSRFLFFEIKKTLFAAYLGPASTLLRILSLDDFRTFLAKLSWGLGVAKCKVLQKVLAPWRVSVATEMRIKESFSLKSGLRITLRIRLFTLMRMEGLQTIGGRFASPEYPDQDPYIIEKSDPDPASHEK